MKTLIAILTLSSSFTFAIPCNSPDCQEKCPMDRRNMPAFVLENFDPANFSDKRDRADEIKYRLWKASKYLEMAQEMPADLEILLAWINSEIYMCIKLAGMER